MLKQAQAAIAVIGLALALSPAAQADSPLSFKDQKITMLIGSAPGGGTDTAGRQIGRFIGKYLPGEPTFIIQNMPGASGITSLNHFVHRTEPNGLTIVMGSNSTISSLTCLPLKSWAAACGITAAMTPARTIPPKSARLPRDQAGIEIVCRRRPPNRQSTPCCGRDRNRPATALRRARASRQKQ